MTQHSTILTEIQLLRNFQVMAPMLKVAGKAEQAEQERKFENVTLLQSLMGGNPRSQTDDRKFTSGTYLILNMKRFGANQQQHLLKY